MRRALLAIALLAAPTLGAQAPTISKFEVAGIPVVFKPVRANDVVAVRLYLRGGSANLTAANAGIEDLMLQAATHGTSRYDKDAFNAKTVETGTTINSAADYDYSVLALQAVRQHWNEAWDLFAEAALHPTYPAAEVELVRAQLVDAARRIPDDPDSYVQYLADSMFFIGHPYASRPTGTPASLTAITRQAIVDWHRQQFTKANLLFVVVGNVDRDDLARKIAATFGSLPAGRPVNALRPFATVTPDVVVVSRELPTNYILGQFAAPAPSSRDYAAMRVATDVLSHRLFEEVRTKRNLTYAVFAGLDIHAANYGSLYVTAVDPDTTMKVMFSEVRRLQREPLSKTDLAEEVNSFLTQFWMAQQSNMGQARSLALFELLGGGYENLARFAEAVRRVTPADVQRVANQYMQQARFAVIGDAKKIGRPLFTSF